MTVRRTEAFIDKEGAGMTGRNEETDLLEGTHPWEGLVIERSQYRWWKKKYNAYKE